MQNRAYFTSTTTSLLGRHQPFTLSNHRSPGRSQTRSALLLQSSSRVNPLLRGPWLLRHRGKHTRIDSYDYERIRKRIIFPEIRMFIDSEDHKQAGDLECDVEHPSLQANTTGHSESRYKKRSYERPRSPSPVDDLAKGPSSEYLQIAEQTPELRAPYQKNYHRKLLILDLNGTLLLRVQRRITQLRPYLNSFRRYLLHEETRLWLDVMVWSSAQPHNVEKMVRRCFKLETIGHQLNTGGPIHLDGNPYWHGTLVAVWARDTLGLSMNAYNRKTQTTKDLEKPWSQLPGDHSALTTILLDDSPKKVRLQPYNHVCVKEYNEALRLRDLRTHVLRSLPMVDSSVEGVSEDPPVESNAVTQEVADEDGAATDNIDDSTPTLTREERRKQKKLRKKALKAAGPATENTANAKMEVGQPKPADTVAKYDETLLAVIGILDTMRLQTNVAAWIRAGGLWGKKRPPVVHDLQTEESEPSSAPRAPSPTDAEVEDTNVEDGTMVPPSELLTKTSPPTSPTLLPTSESDSNNLMPSSDPKSPILRKRQLSGSPSEHDSSVSELKRARNESTLHVENNEIHASQEGSDSVVVHPGNDLESTGLIPPQEVRKVEDSDATTADPPQPKLWFEDEDVFDHWVTEGRRVLRALNIVEDPGISDGA